MALPRGSCLLYRDECVALYLELVRPGEGCETGGPKFFGDYGLFAVYVSSG